MRFRALVFPVVLCSVARLGSAQDPYQRPPDPIPQILDADQTPIGRLSPDRRYLLLLERPGLPPIAEVAAPEMRLAGKRIDPRTSGPSRGTVLKGLRLVPVAGGAERAIEVPAGARIANVWWA